MTRRLRVRWSDDALVQAKKIIHLQDMLITGIGDCFNDIKKYDYGECKYHLEAIYKINKFLINSTRDLLNLKFGQSGPKPRWFELGEDMIHFCLKLDRVRDKIATEIIRNDWDIVETRLKEAERQLITIQRNIIAILPKERRPSDETYVSQRAVTDWDNLLETIKTVSEPTGGRWRNKRK